jgi:hypothetical protein
MNKKIPVLTIWLSSLIAVFSQTPPSITTQPQSAEVALVGSNLTLSVNATGLPTPSYQWQFDGTNIDGESLPTLSLTDMNTGQTGCYDVVITNDYGSVTSSVARITVIAPTIYWTGAGDGQSWNNSTNWNTGMLPTPNDSIFIGATNGTITVSGGLTLSNLLCQCSLSLNGSLNVAGGVEIAQSFIIPAGNSISVIGTNAALIAEGSTTASAVNMYAGLGALISLPGLTIIEGGYNTSTTIEAGPGAVLNLSSVQYMQGPGTGGNGYVAVTVQADAGALVNLSGVTNIVGEANGTGYVVLDANSTNGVINLSSLLSLNGPGQIVAGNGGSILATNLRYMAGNLTALADGTDSVLNFSGSPYLVFGAGSSIQFTAQDGGLLNFDGLQSISGGGASFLANGTGSVIDFSHLSGFTTPLSVSSVTAENGGVILFNNSAVILQNVAVNWAGNGILPPVIPASGLLTLYCQPWDSYWVETLDTRNAADQFRFYKRVPATNGVQVIGGPPKSWQGFQVFAFVANPPIMDLNRLGSTNMQLVLYGEPPNNFEIQTAYSLDTPINWSLYAITGEMTNSFRIFLSFTPTNAEQFFRLQKE